MPFEGGSVPEVRWGDHATEEGLDEVDEEEKLRGGQEDSGLGDETVQWTEVCDQLAGGVGNAS